MSNYVILGVGIGVLIIAAMAFFAPSPYGEYSYPQVVNLCAEEFISQELTEIFVVKLQGQNFDDLVAQECKNVRNITIVIYIAAMGGAILLILGGFLGEKKKDEQSQNQPGNSETKF